MSTGASTSSARCCVSSVAPNYPIPWGIEGQSCSSIYRTIQTFSIYLFATRLPQQINAIIRPCSGACQLSPPASQSCPRSHCSHYFPLLQPPMIPIPYLQLLQLDHCHTESALPRAPCPHHQSMWFPFVWVARYSGCGYRACLLYTSPSPRD